MPPIPRRNAVELSDNDKTRRAATLCRQGMGQVRCQHGDADLPLNSTALIPRLLVFVALLALALSSPASADRRVALIIANSQYQHINTLQNPLADGQAVAARLKQAGFTLLRPVRADSDVQADLNLDEMLKADEALEKAAQDADMVLVFYTGHGLQMDGVAYLVPVELPSLKAESLDSEANRKLLKRRLLELDDLVANLDRHAKVVVAMFDACREIPQLEESSKAVFGGASPFRGLARPQSNGRHRLLAYSASSGELALDGQGQPHSPYLQAWLDEFDHNANRKDLISFFSDVAVQVPDSKGQNPELVISGIPSGTFYFKPPQASPPVTDSELQQAKERIRQLEAQQAAAPPVKPKPYSVLKTESVYGIEMVNIPGGTFQMGCGPNDGKCSDSEKPRHRVTVPAFAMAKTEITQGQWKAVMGSAPPELKFKDCGDDCPVERVSWNDVQAFIKTLNRKTGGHYRLPSEAEWEFACRAGQDTLYCGGNDPDAVAWYGYEKSGKTTHPVGGKQPNAFGLYDMSGNVDEWVQDCWHNSYQSAPGDGSAWVDGANCAYRVLRGGAFDDARELVRCASRYLYDPDSRDLNYGFRVVVSPFL